MLQLLPWKDEETTPACLLSDALKSVDERYHMNAKYLPVNVSKSFWLYLDGKSFIVGLQWMDLHMHQ